MKRNLLVIAICCSLKCMASNEEYFNNIAGTEIIINAVTDVKDPKFQTGLWSKIDKDLSVTDLIIFEIDDQASQPITSAFTCRIDLKIISYNINNIPTTYLKSLLIAYNPATGTPYKSKQLFKCNNGYHLNVTVQSVSYILGNGQTPPAPPFFKLTADIQISRIYKFDPLLVIDPNIVDTTKGLITVAWAFEYGAEEYDLEWTYLDDSSMLAVNNASVSFNSLFVNNVTRITTASFVYRIRRAYPGGYFFYRVRGVHYDKYHRRQTGVWSSATANGVITSFQDGFHDPVLSEKINWQFNETFAEDGKRSEVLSYFDGTQRQRESLTYNQSHRQIVIGETFYDHVGRAAVQTLPVPINDSALIIRYPFNQTAGLPYNFMNWETGGCNDFPLAMDSTYGSAHYYSSKNTDTSDFQKFVPRAFGYPFSVTEFTPDNTGRLRRQSGVGRDHKLGLHDSKYFYGTAEQRDLDRLFGNEVGFSTHYFKNMMIDPNGQISISYIDAHGRTIATALAGESPPNFSALPSNTGAMQQTYDLLDDNLLFSYGKSSNHKILTTSTGNNSFHYTQTSPVLKLGCNADSFCFNGYYDLNITITDDCMNSGLPNGVPYVYTTNNYQNNGVFTFDTLCSTPLGMQKNFTLQLPVGGYQVAKTLTVSTEAVDFYTDYYLRHNQCLADSAAFVQQAIAAIDFSGCKISCEDCINAIGTQDSFITNYLTQVQAYKPVADSIDSANALIAYNAAVIGCDEMCNGLGKCDALYDAMKNDVYPGHQWGQYTINGNGSYTALQPPFISSLFYYTYRHYTDETGKPDLELYNGNMVPPEALPLKDFVTLFKPSWADSLVIYHPEYCYYTYCTNNSTSNAYDDAMMRVATYQEAKDAGYLNPLYNHNYSTFPSNNKDPYFNSSGDGNYFLTDMANNLFHYIDLPGNVPSNLSAWAFAMSVATNVDNPGVYNLTVNDTTYGTQCPGNLNTAWIIFRSIYQTLKYKYFDLRRETYVDNNNQGNGLSCLSNLCMTYAYSPLYVGTNFPDVDANYCNGQVAWYPVGVMPRVIHYEAGMAVNSLTDPADIIAEAEQNASDSLASSCSDACNGQADYWMQQMSGCNMNAAQQSTLRAGFIEVCMAGCDYSHPFGSSTTPNGIVTASGYTSFEDVVTQVLNVSATDVTCNAIIIDAPGPYEVPRHYSSGYLFYEKDACLCEKFNALQDSFNVFGGYASLAEFINAHYASTLSQDQVNEILALCNDPACNFLSEPITLSLALSCDSNGCITCDEYRTKDAAFKQLYPDSNFANYQSYYAGYMNQAFGFNLSFWDYQSFGSECNAPDTSNNGGGGNGNGGGIIMKDSIFNNMVITTITFSPDSIISIASQVICDTMIMPLDTIISSQGNVYTYDTLITCHDTTYQFMDSIQAGGYGSTSVSQTVIQSYTDAVSGLTVHNTITLTGPPITGALDSNSIPPPVFLPKLCGGTQTVSMDTSSCHDQLINMAITNGMNSYLHYLDSLKQAFADLYLAKAMEAAETFTVTKPFDEYHYTLYYYDLPGNLVKTVPPAGVQFLTDVQMDSTALHRSDSTAAIFPAHTLFSRYWYNSLNVPVKQITPDADSLKFWYDLLGRIAVSQSGKQKPSYYSYTLYDALGRTVEAGRIYQGTLMTDATSKSSTALASWLAAGNHDQVTHTHYDISPVVITQFPQSNLRNRVACIEYEELNDANAATWQSAIFYNYDVAGNVNAMYYDVTELKQYGQANKRIDYDYDLVSGKVNRVYYQKDSIDQFIYKYTYDAANRLSNAYTSRDGYLWERDADYQYYYHGPLGRMQIGQRQVQGVDYAYTIEGWMKGVNGVNIDSTHDMSYDGLPKSINSQFAKDIFGFVIGYFDGDYSPIGNTHFEPKYIGSTFDAASPSLYNSNIHNMTASIATLSPTTVGYAYNYDQLNRYIGMNESENFNTASYKWKTSGTATSKWKEQVTYDPNGNILSYIRHGNSPTAMDSLTYGYNPKTNQLNHVDDGVSATNYTVDIDDQNTDTYLYDKSGELTTDVQEGLKIDWTNYGKVKTVTKTLPGKLTIEFTYDPLGNRLSKKAIPFKKTVTITYYFRDAQGNILGTYLLSHPVIIVQGQQPKDSIKWIEQNLYGSSRLGIAQPVKAVMYPRQTPLADTGRLSYFSGWKQYELTNHLGNVLATVSDKKIGVGTGATISYYKAEVISAQDYYPFGMLEVGRNSSSASYRFGFNGQEKDDNIEGNGNSLSFDFRNYSSRLGKFWSIDPISKNYPWNSAYAFAENRIVDGKDQEGLEWASASQLIYTTPVDQSVTGRSNNLIMTSSLNLNQISLHASTLTLAVNVKQSYITDYSARVIEKALAQSNNSKANITSGYRTAKDQARIMYENIQAKGVASQKRLYSTPGDKVIETYENFSPSWNCSKIETCFEMEKTINQVGPENVSKHSSNPEVYNTIDISPKSIYNKLDFKNALIDLKGKEISRYIPPHDDPAHHIEIPQPPKQ